jgi:hypothetical protein
VAGETDVPSGYRRRRRFRRTRHNRGGGVVTGAIPGSAIPMNVLDGGHDAPVGPDSPRTRLISWTILAVVIIGSIAVLIARFA